MWCGRSGGKQWAWQMKIEEISALRWQYCQSICKFHSPRSVCMIECKGREEKCPTTWKHQQVTCIAELGLEFNESSTISRRLSTDQETLRLLEINKKLQTIFQTLLPTQAQKLRLGRASNRWIISRLKETRKDSRGNQRQRNVSWPKREAIALLSNQQTIGSTMKPELPPLDCYLPICEIAERKPFRLRARREMKVLCHFMQQLIARSSEWADCKQTKAN